jgi:tetratricopeptide (TPR) repeat protein
MKYNPSVIIISLVCGLLVCAGTVGAENAYSFSATSSSTLGTRQALSNGPQDAVVKGNATLSNLIKSANTFLVAGNYKDAISYYDKALMLKPNNTILLVNKGNALSAMGNFSGGIKIYDQALLLRPNSTNNTSVFVNRGNDLFQLGKVDEAVKSYYKALAMAPGSTTASEGKYSATLLLKSNVKK